MKNVKTQDCLHYVKDVSMHCVAEIPTEISVLTAGPGPSHNTDGLIVPHSFKLVDVYQQLSHKLF